MLKILLLSPPKFDFYFTPARKEPLGLLYIKSALEKFDGLKVDLYDATWSGKKKKVSTPYSFDYLKEIYPPDKSYFSLFSSYFRFGDSYNKIIDRIVLGSYNIVMVSALFSGYFPDVEELVCRIKDETNALVAVGGWAVDAEKKKLFATSRADFFLCGDDENTLPDFIKTIQGAIPLEKVPGILFRDRDSIVEYPAQREAAITNEFPRRCCTYRCNGKRIASMILSKGCLYNCAFCAVHRYRKFSIRSIQSIDNELTYLLNLGIEIVNFEDDNLFYSERFSREFLDLLKEYHNKGMHFAAMNGITARNILPFADQIVKAGFRELNLSLVTSDPATSRFFHRPFDITTLKKIIHKVNGRISTIVFLILGLPGSSPNKVLRDILELAELPVLIGVSPLYLIPGIPLFEKMGIPSDRRLMRGSALYRFGQSFSREDVASLWKFVRMINRMKKFDDKLSDEDEENLFYFRKSVREKRWYRKEEPGTWKRSFRFDVNLPVKIKVKKLKGHGIMEF